MLRDNEPAVLLNEGDPESLTPKQRSQALRAYVERYGKGGWRGLKVPHIQIHRFASPEIAGDVNELWSIGIENPDVRWTLLYMIETGRISECADIAYASVCDPDADPVERLIALDALVALEDTRLPEIARAVSTNGHWPEEVARGAIVRMFPRDLSVEQLCQTLRRLKESKRSVDELKWQLPRLVEKAELNPSMLESLRDGLVELASDGLIWSKEWPHIVSSRSDLSGVLAATCMRGLDLSRKEDWFRAGVLALRLHNREDGNNDAQKALRKRLSRLDAEDNARLFWATDEFIQSLHAITDARERLTEVIFHDSPIELNVGRDLPWVKKALGDTALPTADRAVLLQAAMRLSPQPERWQDHILALKPLVADQTDLLAVVDDCLKPPKRDKQLERWEKRAAELKSQRERRAAKDRASWILFWREVARFPESAFSSERSWNTAWNLWRAMSQDGADSRASGWNRRFIEEQFGKEIADRLRRILMNIWREDFPTLASERPTEQRTTYLVRWQLGLAAIYAEAEDPNWVLKLSDEQARLAARFALIELNGLPAWLESLIVVHPDAVDAIIGGELSWELTQEPGTTQSILLQSISYAADSVSMRFLPRLLRWLDAKGDDVAEASGLAAMAQRLRQVIGVMLKCGDENIHAHVLAVAGQRLQDGFPIELSFVWLAVLMRIDPELGVTELEKRLLAIDPGPSTEAVAWFSVLFGDRHDAINLRSAAFAPLLLLRLLRLAYRHVRPRDDVKHESSYSPDVRDHAERARNEIVGALFDAKGEDGWSAKLEMADDPLCAHFRDRILSVAEEHWAQEIDFVALDEAQAVALDRTGEAPAATNEAMFATMNDRLADLDDLLLRDSSPREAWLGISDEKVMRREIARELSHAANGVYKVDQEAVTADEKETDIRLRSVISDCEAVIELKLGDGRTARDLRDTIYNQLVKKYMAAENSRSGCLLVTLAKDRKWEHPDNGKRIGPEELVSFLRDEAKRVQEMMGGVLALTVHLLDLRARLPVEKPPK